MARPNPPGFFVRPTGKAGNYTQKVVDAGNYTHYPTSNSRRASRSPAALTARHPPGDVEDETVADSTLEALGFTKEEIADRIIDRAVAQLLQATAEDEDGFSYGVPSTFASKIDKVIREKIDAAVIKAGDEVIEPRITSMVEGHVLQKTNEWGERRGEPVSFTEYLVQRAEAYMTEQVNYEGKTQKEGGGYPFTAKGTRVAYMIDKHLHYSIDTAMRKALQEANTTIGKGLSEAVNTAIKNITVNVKTEVKS